MINLNMFPEILLSKVSYQGYQKIDIFDHRKTKLVL